MKSLSIIITLVFAAGCGPMMLPGPTTKPVTKADIVGVWKYDADYEKTNIALELKADGTFIQTIKRSGTAEPQVHSGTWDLDGSSPKLTVLKPVFADDKKPWILESVNWWIVDSNQDGLKFAICGAADDRDPDSCFEMKKIR